MWHDTLLNAHPVQIRRGEASARAPSALWLALMPLTRLTWGLCPWAQWLCWSSGLCPASLLGCVVGCWACPGNAGLCLHEGALTSLDPDSWLGFLAWHLACLASACSSDNLDSACPCGSAPFAPLQYCGAGPWLVRPASLVVAPKIHLWRHRKWTAKKPCFLESLKNAASAVPGFTDLWEPPHTTGSSWLIFPETKTLSHVKL